jgi:hypothetical protein
MANWDSGITWDSGASWDEAMVAPKTKRMAKVKLDLRSKTDDQLRTFGTEHKAQITGNAAFPTPQPAPAVYDPKLAAFGSKLDAIAAAEFALQASRAERDVLRSELELMLNGRGSYVEVTSGGDAAKILSAGFQIVSAASPTSSLPAPTNVLATMGDNPGEIDVSGNAVAKAKSYIYECREHADGAVSGPWAQVKVGTRSSFTVRNLTSGKKYAFRMKALGPNDLESPWSDEAVCMAP